VSGNTQALRACVAQAEATPATVVPAGTGAEIARRGLAFDGETPRLIASECVACAAKAWPPATRCHLCWSEVRELSLSRTGALYAYTRVHVGPPGIEVPYVVGYVDLPEGVRVFTHVRGDASALAIDGSVTLHGAPDGPGAGFWFEVAR
jgi:uncharacterized OB-fold protein